jgi:hypothetical protein
MPDGSINPWVIAVVVIPVLLLLKRPPKGVNAPLH